jgi:hypothetical protein
MGSFIIWPGIRGLVRTVADSAGRAAGKFCYWCACVNYVYIRTGKNHCKDSFPNHCINLYSGSGASPRFAPRAALPQV